LKFAPESGGPGFTLAIAYRTLEHDGIQVAVHATDTDQGKRELRWRPQGMWSTFHFTVAGLALLVSAGSLGLAVAAFLRSGRNALEDQRDRLLAQVTEMTTGLWQRDSELVILLHRHARCPEGTRKNYGDIVATTTVLRDSLREQIGAMKTLFAAIAQDRGLELRKRLLARRVQLFEHAPLLAAQTQDISEHIRVSTERLQVEPNPR
jgi:hypothetical protein